MRADVVLLEHSELEAAVCVDGVGLRLVGGVVVAAQRHLSQADVALQVEQYPLCRLIGHEERNGSHGLKRVERCESRGGGVD